MRLYTKDQEQAIEFAKRAHEHLLQVSPKYAANMERWAVPQRDYQLDKNGDPVLDKDGVNLYTGNWYILVEPSVEGAFTADELMNTEPKWEPVARI